MKICIVLCPDQQFWNITTFSWSQNGLVIMLNVRNVLVFPVQFVILSFIRINSHKGMQINLCSCAIDTDSEGITEESRWKLQVVNARVFASKNCNDRWQSQDVALINEIELKRYNITKYIFINIESMWLFSINQRRIKSFKVYIIAFRFSLFIFICKVSVRCLFKCIP